MKPDCSWTDSRGNRLFGHFIRWEGDFVIARITHSQAKSRIYKSNITFEQG